MRLFSVISIIHRLYWTQSVKILLPHLTKLGKKIVFQLTEIRLIAGSQRSISCFTDPIFWTSNSYYFCRLSQNSLPAFKTVSLPTFTLSENKRTRKLDCHVRHPTSILENCLKKSMGANFGIHTTLSIRIQHPNINNTVEVKFKEYFYELFLFMELKFMENSVGKNSVSMTIREGKL